MGRQSNLCYNYCMPKVSIVIPVYNEEKYLPNFLKLLLKELKNIPQIMSVIIINDGSIDSTKAIITKVKKRHKNIFMIDSNINKGKGYSMRLGFIKAQELNSDRVIFMDGDGQHDPISLREFLLELDHYPIVFGYRILKKDAPIIRKLGNQISNLIIRNIFNIKRNGDILCGYFAIRSDIYNEIAWYSNDYGVEAEISAIIGRKMIPFKEILVKTIYLDQKKGVNLFHALQILLRIPYLSRVHSYS